MLRFSFLLLTVLILPLVFGSAIERNQNLEDEENVLRELQELLDVKALDEVLNLEERGSCIPLGGKGCQGDDSQCCREGDPYTSKHLKCINIGSLWIPEYQCQD